MARSHAVSAAITGDPAPLHHFVRTGLAGEQSMDTNLTYWVYCLHRLLVRVDLGEEIRQRLHRKRLR